jgi:hypothetical protein
LLDHEHEHGGQKHGRHDLPLLQGKGTGGPHIGLLQGAQQGRGKGTGEGCLPYRPAEPTSAAENPSWPITAVGQEPRRGRGYKGWPQRPRPPSPHQCRSRSTCRPRWAPVAPPAQTPQQAAQAHHQATEPGVADPGPHRLPAGMADVEGVGEVAPRLAKEESERASGNTT